MLKCEIDDFDGIVPNGDFVSDDYIALSLIDSDFDPDFDLGDEDDEATGD